MAGGHMVRYLHVRNLTRGIKTNKQQWLGKSGTRGREDHVFWLHNMK